MDRDSTQQFYLAPGPASEEPFELPSHEQLILQSYRGAYQVVEGYLAVYMVRVRNGQPVGQRQYLMTCHEGVLMCGLPIKAKNMRYVLIAVPLGDCKVRAVDTQRLLDVDDPEYDVLWQGVENWTGLLCQQLADQGGSQYAEPIVAGDSFELGEGQTLRPATRELRWLKLDQGAVAFFNDASFVARAGDRPLAVTAPLWFGVNEPTRGELVAREPDADHLRLFFGVLFLVQFAVAWFYAQQVQRNRAEVARFRTLAKQRERDSLRAVRNLSKAFENEEPFDEGQTPLEKVVHVLGRDYELALKLPLTLAENAPPAVQADAIARASGTRVRRVRLGGEWWTDDVGALLAFKKETGCPVALLNIGKWMGLSRRYEMLDPERNAQIAVDESIADELAIDAWAFLSPLPDTSTDVSLKALARFTFRPFFPDLRLMFLLSLVAGLIGLLMPVANFLMIDKVIPDSNRELMVDLSIGLALMSLGIFLFQLSQGLVSLRVQTALTARLQSAIIDRLLRLPARFFRKYSSGDMLNRAMMISEISAGFTMTVVSGLTALLSVLMMLALSFYYSKQLAWLALFTALLTSIFSITFSFMIRRKALSIELASGKLFGFVVQMINGVSKLQIAGAEERAFGRWASDYGEQLRLQYEIARLQQYSGLVNMTIQTGSTAALFYFAGLLVQQTQALQSVNPLTPPLLTIATFFAFQAAFNGVVGGIVNFFQTFITAHQQLIKRELVRPLLEQDIEIGEGRIDPGRLDGHVMMSKVGFRYYDGGPLILNDVSISAFPGEFVAIVGPSGSGKSTLLKLLLGFEEATSGQISFDRQDIDGLDMTMVRRQIGVVLQDGKLNAGTIFQNISGASQIALEDAWEAAEATGLAEDIRSFPMEMHTLMPEGGTTLSGGQRQRMMIARALAINPRIVIFDEATSALDNRTQQIVTESLRQRKITRVVVAHRLSTIRDADRIYVLDGGVIRQEGDFDTLMEQEGLFRRLAKRQIA